MYCSAEYRNVSKTLSHSIAQSAASLSGFSNDPVRALLQQYLTKVRSPTMFGRHFVLRWAVHPLICLLSPAVLVDSTLRLAR